MADLKQKVVNAFQRTVQNMIQQDALLVGLTYLPERMHQLDLAHHYGLDSIIIGGPEGDRVFPDIPQVGVPGVDTRGMSKSSETTRKIVQQYPYNGDYSDVFIYTYSPLSPSWSSVFQSEHPEINILASPGGTLRSFIENKLNLETILTYAGLKKHVIPNKVFESRQSPEKVTDYYNTLRDEEGRVVIQCGLEEGWRSAGGRGTVITTTLEKTLKIVAQREGNVKMSSYISGSEGNLSFVCGNMMPARYGCKRVEIPPDFDVGDHGQVEKLLAMSLQEGIGRSTVYGISGRATLKVVGEPMLTPKESSGVGNSLAYVYPKEQREKISDIGNKLSHFLATLGWTNVAGCDLIFDDSGQVYVNEINSRPQGPSERMSEDAEKVGLPSLTKLAFLNTFADFSEPYMQQLVSELRQANYEIGQAYSTNRKGSFYIKVASKESLLARRDLPQGIYDVIPVQDGWSWEWSGYSESFPKTVSPANGSFRVSIGGGSLENGQPIEKGRQLFRILGVPDTCDCSPFIIQNNQSVLNPYWIKPLECLYSSMLTN